MDLLISLATIAVSVGLAIWSARFGAQSVARQSRADRAREFYDIYLDRCVPAIWANYHSEAGRGEVLGLLARMKLYANQAILDQVLEIHTHFDSIVHADDDGDLRRALATLSPIVQRTAYLMREHVRDIERGH